MPIINSEFFDEENIQELVNQRSWMTNHEFRLCASVEELASFIDEAIKIGRCALDTETTGLNTRIKYVKDPTAPNGFRKESCSKLVSFCLSYESNVGLYVPVGHQEGAEFNLPLTPVLDQIRRLCSFCVTIYHNAKFDLAIMANYGIIVNRFDQIEETEILSRLYDTGTKFVGLKPTVEKILGRKMLEIKDISPNIKRIDMISPKIAATYGASDAICTLDLYTFFMSQKIVQDQMPIYNLEKRIVFVVLNMESNLVKVDIDYLKKAKTKALAKLAEITDSVKRLAGRDFNIGSTQQLGKILFDDLGYTYPDKKKTASGQWKTDTATLEKIAKQYPIVQSIIEYRALEKCLGTYVDNLLINHDEDGFVKLGFKQTGTDTGRFSSPGGDGIEIDGYSGVNVQSLPGASDDLPDWMPDIRRSFMARPGYKIVAADYSGEELRVATNLSKEPKWIEEFLHGDADLHSATARAIFQKSKISKEERKLGKVINFLVMYGGGAHGLAEQAHISEREARRLLDAFFKGLPVLKKWIDLEIIKARKLKYSKTVFGRIRPLHMFYDTGDRASEAHADRCAVNHLIQGASADIIKTAMVRIFNYIQKHNLQDEIHMLITMHDEIVFEIAENKLDEYIPILDNIMRLEDILQGKLKWEVPLIIDAEYGDSWHVTNNYFEEHPDRHLKEQVLFQRSDTAVQAPVNLGKPVTKPLPEAITEKVPETESHLPEEGMEKVSPDKPLEVTSEVKEDTQVTPSPVPPGQPVSEEKPVVKEASEDSLKNHLTSTETVIYTIRDRRNSTLRKMNDILSFLLEEGRRDVGYQGPKKIVVIRDDEGNLLSEIRVYPDAFLALSRYYGI